MSRVLELLDAVYAGSLGCSPSDLNSGRLMVIESDVRSIRFARGSPLVVYGLAKPGSAVMAVRPRYGAVVGQAAGGSNALDAATCDAVERVVSPLVEGGGSWFRGIRLVCEPDSFRDSVVGEAREMLPDEDEHARALHRRWGAKVFGQMVDGDVVSWAAVKPLSDVVWDLSIDTLPEHRGCGYAKSAASAALRYVFASGRLAGWGCDCTNYASLRVARSIGFRHYALDFGCIGAPVDDADERDSERKKKG